MAKIKVFGLFLEKKSSDFVDFQYWSPFLLCLTTGARKMTNLNVFCLISRIDSVNTCKKRFSWPFSWVWVICFGSYCTGRQLLDLRLRRSRSHRTISPQRTIHILSHRHATYSLAHTTQILRQALIMMTLIFFLFSYYWRCATFNCTIFLVITW